jgi:galactonate dehydratase
MEIAAIDLHVLRAGLRSPWGVLCVETRSGERGIGEVAGLWGNVDIGAKVEHVDHFESLFVGRDPRNVSAIRATVQEAFWGGSRLSHALLSGLETACLDLKGQADGVPIADLLGGRLREAVPVYANGWWGGLDDPEDLAAGAERLVDRGYGGLKFSPFEDADRTIDNAELERVADRVAAVREAVGPEPDLMIEGHGRFVPATAIRVGERLAPHEPRWFEAPIRPHLGPEVHRRVRDRCSVPIATDLAGVEHGRDAFDYLAADAVDVIQPDPGNAGGCTEIRDIGTMAEAAGAVVCPHAASSPVGLAACLQVDAVLPNLGQQECFAEFAWPSWVDDVFDHEIAVEDGTLSIPSSPGLGIDFDPAAAADLGREGLDRDDLFTGGGGGIATKQWVAERPPGWLLDG